MILEILGTAIVYTAIVTLILSKNIKAKYTKKSPCELGHHSFRVISFHDDSTNWNITDIVTKKLISVKQADDKTLTWDRCVLLNRVYSKEESCWSFDVYIKVCERCGGVTALSRPEFELERQNNKILETEGL